MNRLVVVPSDPISAYEAAGYDYLERYYNPGRLFREVFAISPMEKGRRDAYGMTILGVSERNAGRVMRELRPDVVRAYGGYGAADLACRFRPPGVPVVVSVHDTNPDLLHEAVCYADRVLCVSKAVAVCVERKGVEPERIQILPNRVDLKLFQPVLDSKLLQRLASQFPPGKHLLHVGRRTEQKNLDTVLRALAILPAEYSCVFVGQGKRDPYELLAAQLGVGERCFWVDSVKNSELPLWYSWCDCMCTPSRWEGFGIVFIEAAACGAVIVTSDIAPMNEYLADGVNASLVKDHENPDALAVAVRRACEDGSYRQQLQANTARVAAAFDREAIDAQEIAIYRDVAAGGTASFPAARQIAYESWRKREAVKSLLRPLNPRRVLGFLKRCLACR